MEGSLTSASRTDLPEQGLITRDADVDADLPKLIGYYEAAEEASRQAREKAERDRDYVDNKQLTQDEVDKLRKRGQPPIALNVIRSRAAFLGGMEKKQRRDPKAWPRSPKDADAAEAFTDGMRYAVERGDYASKRSQAWKNITIEGFGGIEIAAVRKGSRVEFNISRIPWDRMGYDPHSSEPGFEDAKYKYQVAWFDFDDALDRALSAGQVDEARAREILSATLSSAPATSRTYDDKPRWQVWADGKRNRVRIVMMWHREVDGWKYCEFTKAGKLSWADAPYVDQDGESYCPWPMESANVDRENNRYGEIRHLIDPQDEINKRRQKALHQSVSRGVVADAGAVDDKNQVRRELAKPDFYVEKQQGLELKIIDGQELAAGQAMLLREAMDYVMQAGPNAALLGKGVQDQSGRAIEAQQAGGLVEQSDLMDCLRRLDLKVFNILASMMKQFWDAEMWIRVTDDEETPRFVGLNQPMLQEMETGHVAPQEEWRRMQEQGYRVGQLVPATRPDGSPMLFNDVARLDLDILVSDAPDTISLDSENYAALIDLLGSVISRGLPPDILKIAIEMHPALPAKRKKQLMDLIEKAFQPKAPPPGAEDAARLSKEKIEADIAATRAKAYRDLTTGEATMASLSAPIADPPRPEVAEGFGDAPEPPEPQPGPMPGAPPGQPTPAPQALPAPGAGPQPGPPPVPPQVRGGGPMAGMMTGRPSMVA